LHTLVTVNSPAAWISLSYPAPSAVQYFYN